jgi:ATP-dependent protease HslVU (ClpYQ) peptidase subunit
MYSRTIRRGPGVVAVGSVILRATILIVNGSCSLLDGEGQVRQLTGYNVLSGLAGRKSLSLTHSDVEMTMIFPTLAKTVEEAENEIFGEADELMSRKDGSRDVVVVTGE